MANFHDFAHTSGGLHHAFARLELNDIRKLEYKCNVWRVQTVEALTPARQPWQASTSGRPGKCDAMSGCGDNGTGGPRYPPQFQGSPGTAWPRHAEVDVGVRMHWSPSRPWRHPRPRPGALACNGGPTARCPSLARAGQNRRSFPPSPDTSQCEIPPPRRTTNAQCPTAHAAPRRSRSASPTVRCHGATFQRHQ